MSFVIGEVGQEALAGLDVEQLPVVEVGPGCTRRDLPALPGVRAWVVDMAPAARGPTSTTIPPARRITSSAAR